MSFAEIIDAEVWLNNAPHGSELEYYRGNLWRAREARSRNARTVNVVADLMLGHSGAYMPRSKHRLKGPKRVVLYQIKHGEFDYSYMARRTE